MARVRGPDEAAVSDIVGSILLVGITIMSVGGFAVLLFAFDGPPDVQHTELAATLDPGGGGWNSGDEQVRLTHLGGEALADDDTTVQYTVGATTTTLSGVDLASAFADGRLTIGEVWTRTLPLALNDEVTVRVAVRSGDRGQLLASATVTAGSTTAGNICLGDATPPIASSFAQSPTDVDVATLTAVTVTVTVSDACSGVNGAVNPVLQWRVTPRDATFTSAGAMTALGGNQWSGTIPGPATNTWSSLVGQTLEYKVTGMTDANGNAGDSAVQGDLVNLVFTYYAPLLYTVTEGSLSAADFLKIQNAADSGQEGIISEAAGGSAGTDTQNTNGIVSSSGWAAATTAKLQSSNDDYATNANSNPNYLQVRFGDPALSPNTITQVLLKAEVSITGFTNDGWRQQACISTTCSTQSATVTGFSSDSTITYDVTNQRPGGGTWSWNDVISLENRITPIKNGGSDGTWRVDYAWIEVSHVPTWTETVQFDWPIVPAGGTKQLEIRHHTAGDTFNVQVWDGSAFNTRGTTLDASSATLWSYTLTAGEGSALGGAVRVRFVDVTPDGQTQGQLFLDYARVGRA